MPGRNPTVDHGARRWREVLRGVAETLAQLPRGAAPLRRLHLRDDAPSRLYQRHNGPDFRGPTDLAVTAAPPRRVLIVGSCMAAGWADYIPKVSPGCHVDYVLLNHVSELPAQPPAPVPSRPYHPPGCPPSAG